MKRKHIAYLSGLWIVSAASIVRGMTNSEFGIAKKQAQLPAPNQSQHEQRDFLTRFTIETDALDSYVFVLDSKDSSERSYGLRQNKLGSIELFDLANGSIIAINKLSQNNYNIFFKSAEGRNSYVGSIQVARVVSNGEAVTFSSSLYLDDNRMVQFLNCSVGKHWKNC